MRNYNNPSLNTTPLNTQTPWYSQAYKDLVTANQKQPWNNWERSNNFHTKHLLGMRQYSLSDHLGNVLATILDRKTGHLPGVSATNYDYWTADIANAQYYYPFGSMMPGKIVSATNGYRFGFNGQEKVDEISGSGNHIGFDERGYDPRTGRWWSVDPLFAKYPYQSPYSFVGNNPILNREIDGRDYGVYIDHNTKTIIIKATYYTVKGNESSHTSAVQATQFWNEQSGKYQYTVGKGDAAVTYDVKFELTVTEVDNPNKEENADKLSPETASNLGITRLTPDQSSNTYGVLPDADKAFENGEEGQSTNGTTKGGALVSVKDSQKTTETGSHEVGHTLGLGHFSKGVLTAASNDPNRSKTITGRYIKGIISNAFKKTDEAVGKGTIHETGTAPEKFSKGKVTEKK